MKKCFTCGKETMFVNQANSLTCKNCGQICFPASSEEHRKLLCLVFELYEELKKYGDLNV